MAEKEFVCEICGAEFDNGADWERHNRKDHSRYTCETCHDTFGAEEEFQSHNFKMHPELQKIPR
jgi:transposase-like protein